MVYLAGNVLCLSFQASSTVEVGKRAGRMALVNMVPLFAGSHISSLADALGVRLVTARLLHRSIAAMVSVLVLVHLLFALAAAPSFGIRVAQDLFAIVVSVRQLPPYPTNLIQGAASLCLCLVLAHPSIRRLSYEVFLRGHQALAALLVYALWRHVPSHATVPRAFLYITVTLFSVICLTKALLIAFRNGIVTHRHARAHLSQSSCAVGVRIYLEKPVTTQPGQHINLWIPSVSFWSFTQSHPFVVISWADGPQEILELFVEPRRGLTRELLLHAESQHKSSPLVLISGPHGRSEAVDGYESVLMVASGFGIAAQIPYLKRLIHGHNAHTVHTRRIHLVWEFRDIGEHHQERFIHG